MSFGGKLSNSALYARVFRTEESTDNTDVSEPDTGIGHAAYLQRNSAFARCLHAAGRHTLKAVLVSATASAAAGTHTGDPGMARCLLDMLQRSGTAGRVSVDAVVNTKHKQHALCGGGRATAGVREGDRVQRVREAGGEQGTLACFMSSVAMRMACLTTSWWKNGAARARRPRSTSTTSPAATYSFNIALMRSLASSNDSVASARNHGVSLP